MDLQRRGEGQGIRNSDLSSQWSKGRATCGHRPTTWGKRLCKAGDEEQKDKAVECSALRACSKGKGRGVGRWEQQNWAADCARQELCQEEQGESGAGQGVCLQE